MKQSGFAAILSYIATRADRYIVFPFFPSSREHFVKVLKYLQFLSEPKQLRKAFLLRNKLTIRADSPAAFSYCSAIRAALGITWFCSLKWLLWETIIWLRLEAKGIKECSVSTGACCNAIPVANSSPQIWQTINITLLERSWKSLLLL